MSGPTGQSKTSEVHTLLQYRDGQAIQLETPTLHLYLFALNCLLNLKITYSIVIIGGFQVKQELLVLYIKLPFNKAMRNAVIAEMATKLHCFTLSLDKP